MAVRLDAPPGLVVEYLHISTNVPVAVGERVVEGQVDFLCFFYYMYDDTFTMTGGSPRARLPKRGEKGERKGERKKKEK